MFSRLFDIAARCFYCNMICSKADPMTVTHGDHIFCRAQCADNYWMKKAGSRRAA